MDLPSSPEIDMIRAEARALTATLNCVEAGELSDDARALVRDLYEVFMEPTLAEEHIVSCAQARILGRTPTVELFTPTSEPADEAIFEVTGRAWMIWATGAGRRAEALSQLQAIPAPKGNATEGQAIHLMALHPWVLAVTALLVGNHEEALRQFRRATELGGQLGTESNHVVQWTYAASVLPTAEG